MDRELVSVVMPAYNSERYIHETIESIIKQSYNNWEMIIVEDCSTDRTYEEILKFNDSRITVLKNDTNKGISFSTNRALDKCQGKYIALMDNDDIALPDRLKLQVDFLENNKDIDVLGGRSIEINEKNELLTYCNEPKRNPKFIKAELLFHMVNFTNSTLMFRHFFVKKNDITLRENCYGIQDFRFYIDCSKVGNLTSLEQPLIKHRIYSTSTTKNMLRNNFRERAEVYARTQRESLADSGFSLTDEQFRIINQVTCERNTYCCRKEEIEFLRDTFCCILKQGEKMKIDYLAELNAVCKKIFLNELYKLDLFCVNHSDNGSILSESEMEKPKD